MYPAGGNYDNLFVTNIFAGREPQSVVPGTEESAIFYAPNAVGASIQGFTVQFGKTLKVSMSNRTGAPVVITGKMIGRAITA